MLNPELKLNIDMFGERIEQVPIRQGFGEGLLAAGEKNLQVVGLCADLTESTKMDLFAKRFPERFIEMGVAEQNLASVASGLAAMGKIPFISSYAMFSPGRNWEQIRTTVCYNNQPVKIAGSHAGISVGPDGGTHQAIEDIAITRVLPRMIVLSPADAIEAKKATLASVDTGTPVYIRLAREKTPIMTTGATPFEIGRAQIYWQSTKPQDERAIIELAKKTGKIVTVEEHQISGGMGSAVAECLVKNFPVPMEFIGVDDQFGQSGTPDELIKHYGMDTESIIKSVHKILKR